MFEILVDLLEWNDLNRVTELALRLQRHDFDEVVVVAPEGAVIRVLAGDERKKRNVDAVADETDGRVVTADRQELEPQLDPFLCSRAVDDGVDLALTDGLDE